MIKVGCPLCGKDDASPVMSAPDRLGLAGGIFHLVRCACCGLVYTNPRPGDDELARCYPRTYWGERQGGLGELLRGLEERLKEGYKLRVVERAGLGGGRVLDAGCGRGEFLALLKARGFEVMGVEPGEEAAKRGRQDYGIEIINGTLGTAALPEGRFDAATMWHVLEHLPDPLAALGAAGRSLRPGGILVLAVPDMGSWQAARFGPDWLGIDAPRHLTHFTRGTLSAMLEKAGFRLRGFHGIGPRYETAMLVRSLLPGLNYRKLRALEDGLPSRYLYKAVQLALDMALLPVGVLLWLSGRGCAIIVVADKPGEGEVI